MLMVFRIVCGVGKPVFVLSVVSSGVEDTLCAFGTTGGRDGVLSREAGCERAFLAILDCGTAGRGEVGGSAAGRVRTGKDMLSLANSQLDPGELEPHPVTCKKQSSSPNLHARQITLLVDLVLFEQIDGSAQAHSCNCLNVWAWKERLER